MWLEVFLDSQIEYDSDVADCFFKIITSRPVILVRTCTEFYKQDL